MDAKDIISLNVNEITPYDNNPRINGEAVEKVANSIRDFGFTSPIIVDSKNVIICGHTRLKAAKLLGLQTVPVIVADWLNAQQVKALRLADNKVGEIAQWDFDALDKELAGIFDFDMEDFGFIMEDIDTVLDDEESPKESGKGSLAEKFLFAPTSVLRTTKGEWQQRKRAWYELGIAKGEGREEMVSAGSLAGTVPGYYSYKEKAEKDLGRKLTNKEFNENYFEQYYPKDSQIKSNNSGGILSLFDPVLCELMYHWFNVTNDTILDPFSGGSVRGVVASKTGHQYTGIDLRQEQIDANVKNAGEICNNNIPKYICGNSCNIIDLAKGEYDMVFSCPPYYDLEQYSDNPEDLSNMEYEDFLKNYRQIIRDAVSMLKEDRFAVFVVGEVRNPKKGGIYWNFVPDTIKAFEDAGAHFYNEIILLTTVGSAAVRIPKMFQSARKVGKIHQNVLVFYKGNPKHIKANFGDVEIADVFEEENED